MDARATGQGKDITAGSSKKSVGPACAYGLLNWTTQNWLLEQIIERPVQHQQIQGDDAGAINDHER
jgi:hypothetical protein